MLSGHDQVRPSWRHGIRDAPKGSFAEAPREWAAALDVSSDALQLYLESDVIDLHVDSFIWTRLFGYDLRREHACPRWRGYFWGQADFPRVRRAGLTGATWVITTNPLKGARRRTESYAENLRRLCREIDQQPGFALVRNVAEYERARANQQHAAFIGIQGGNALPFAQSAGDPELVAYLADGTLTRVTLVHLSNSGLGATSSPLNLAGTDRLTAAGLTLIEALNAHRVFVDLAHMGRRCFFEAIAAHSRSLPILVTHTGVSGVYPHWRNLDDEQLRAIAQSGGTVGVMYHSHFLGDPAANGQADSIVRHIDHIVHVVGDDHASLGSDWDGAIITPRDMPTCLELPRLVQLMLDRGWQKERIRKILGGNFLRCLRALRG